MRRSIPVRVDSVEALLQLLLRWSATTIVGLLLGRPREEAIMIDYFLYTDARLRWIARPTLLPLLGASSGNDDLWPFTCTFPGCNGRCSASVAYPLLYSGIRAVLCSVLVWIFCCTALIGSIGVEKMWKLIVWYDWMASLHSFSVVCMACPYRLESPLRLATCMISGLSQHLEVTCSSILMKIEIFWWLRFGLIVSIRWDFHWDYRDVIYEIPCGVQGAALKSVGPTVIDIYCSGLIVPLQ
jgi:hypothetical protein